MATQIAIVFTVSNPTGHYVYDLGDDWWHTITLVAVMKRDFTVPYPRCVGGALACPPEDYGGVSSYADIVAGMLDEATRRWLPHGYDAVYFDPVSVQISDPWRRLAYFWYGDTQAGDMPYDDPPRSAAGRRRGT